MSQSLAMLLEDKLQRCRDLLQEAVGRKTLTLRELQSLLGHLNLTWRVVVLGRAFLRQIYALTHKVKKHYHHVKMTKEVKADFQTWFHFLSEYNGRSFYLLDAVYTERALQFYTKTIGYGPFLVAIGCMEHGLGGTSQTKQLSFTLTTLL